MILKNRFKEEDKIRVWGSNPYCAICGSNYICSLHHILGTESDSILNSVMLCINHHKEADGHNVSDQKYQAPLLQYTLRQALKEGYELTKKDIHFYNKHKTMYNKEDK